jgi:hypothetical protein
VHQPQLFESTKDIYVRVFRSLCPRAALPEISVVFKTYRNANCYIRWRNGRIEASHSDLLQFAPVEVVEAIAFILLSRLYRKATPSGHQEVYRRYLSDPDTRARVEETRRERGGKRMLGPQGKHFDLDVLFRELNRDFFGNSLSKPRIGWTEQPSHRVLGHYDPVHHAIVLSRFLDTPEAGVDLVRYVMFHEMLHIKHPITYEGTRRIIHSRAFREEEVGYPGFAALKEKLERLCQKAARSRRSRGRR